ncbi:MAG: hypothetical protein RR902_05660 [Oscillospiraceae bacterium]
MISGIGRSNFSIGVNYAQMNNMRLSQAMQKNSNISSVNKVPAINGNLDGANAKAIRNFQSQMTEMMSKSSSLRDGYFKPSASSTQKPDNEKTAVALDEMVKSFNKAYKGVSEKSNLGIGFAQEKRRMEYNTVSENAMKEIGISKNKDGTLAFDKTEFIKATEKAPEKVKETVSRVASDIFSDATAGMNTSSASLLSNAKNQNSQQNIFEQQSMSKDTAQFLNMYSKSGAYNMLNLGLVGTLMNFSI